MAPSLGGYHETFVAPVISKVQKMPVAPLLPRRDRPTPSLEQHDSVARRFRRLPAFVAGGQKRGGEQESKYNGGSIGHEASLPFMLTSPPANMVNATFRPHSGKGNET